MTMLAYRATPAPGTEHVRALIVDRLRSVPDETLEAAADSLVAVLDLRRGDPDVELNGDELDDSFCEDDFSLEIHAANWEGHPGCPLSDPGENDDGF